MHQIINGWTKERMKAQIRKHNNGKRAKDPQRLACSYQTDDGNRCAVGCFLTEEQAIEADSGCRLISVSDLLTLAIADEKQFPLDENGMADMQSCHDGCRVGDVREALDRFIEEECAES